MKVISFSHSSVQGGYSRSASCSPPHGHLETRASIQHVASRVSASTTMVASGMGERANPTNFLLKEQGRSCLYSFLPLTFHWAELSDTVTSRRRGAWGLVSHQATMCPTQLCPHKRRRGRMEVEEGLVSYHLHHICILVIHHYLKIWRPILGPISGISIQGKGVKWSFPKEIINRRIMYH